MMKKIITSPYRKLKVLIVLPVFAIIFYAFAIPSYRYTVPDGITGNVQSMAEPLNDADHSSSKSTDEQEKTISQVKGTITREDGTPIFRVAILVTGTQARANTDKSGKFTLNDVPTGSRIVISARGYLTQLIKPEENLIVQMLKDPEYKEKATSEALSKSLVIINGNISSLSLSDIQDSITPDQIATVSVFKGDEAVKKYGEKGKDGAVEIITKDKAKEKWIARRAFVVVEEMPMYPGGDKALLEYISNNTKYPQDARDKKIEGRVIIRFIVTSKGTVEDATVLKSAYPSLDAEALRVVSSLPAFLPGSQGGTPVDVYYKVPINFSLKEKETK